MAEKSRKILDLEKIIARAYLIKQRKKILDEEFKESSAEVSSKLTKMMSDLGLDEYEFEADESSSYMFKSMHERISCKKVVSESVEYNAKAVYERAGKEARKVLIDKTYTVNDMDGLVKLLKEHGVSPKEFKKFIDVDMKVNEARLEQLYQTGAISMKDLEGCYSVKTIRGYWSIRSKSSNDKER